MMAFLAGTVTSFIPMWPASNLVNGIMQSVIEEDIKSEYIVVKLHKKGLISATI